MTALGEQLSALGYFRTTAIADTAITAGQVYRDGNSQVRVCGHSACIVADDLSNADSQVAGLNLRDNVTSPPERGVSPAIY